MKARILLVEDSDTQAAYTKELLEGLGYEVLWCKTGIEALKHVGHAGLGNPQPFGDIHRASIALVFDQMQDLLEVIVHRDGAAGASGLIGHGRDASVDCPWAHGLSAPGDSLCGIKITVRGLKLGFQPHRKP